ncbi:MAG: oligoendopeptidase F [Firmicutes bacterium]|nr:oligoendopeptidase F [Bacillota bacterium]
MILTSTSIYAEGTDVPTREDIADEYKWDLEDIYENDEAWEKDYKKLEEMILSIDEYKGKLNESGETLLKALKLKDKAYRLVEKLYVYANMKSDENTANEKYLSLADRAVKIYVKLETKLSFMNPEILEISKKKIDKFFRKEDDLEVYKFYIENLFRSKEHSLTAAEERILALSGEMASTPDNIYNIFDNRDRKLAKIKNENGEEVTLTPGTYSKMLDSTNRDLRKRAFEGEFNSYKDYINVLATNLSGEVKKNIFYAKSRKYDSALEAALSPDNIEPEVYENLLKAVNNKLEPLHKYVSLRKKLLGIEDKVHYYDMYVNMVPSVSSDIDYEDAKGMVSEALQPLGDEYISDLNKGFDNGWIDVYETQNKRSGAYAWGGYDTHPYVLLNYNGTLNNVSTLAHEMGHALNSYYSNEKQPYITADYPTFTAEVASTTNEALMLDYLIKNAESKKEKMYLINSYLEQIRGSIYTQLMYAEFEKIIHDKAEAGVSLNASTLNETWGNLMKKYYGEDFAVDELVKLWWARIPHFYMNFYVYKYATGLSAGITLSDQIVNDGNEARENYLEFLAAGGSDYPVELLKNAGVDMSTTEPVEKALDKFDELVDEFEVLLNEE